MLGKSIRKLPAGLVAQIAAGEVIENPANLIKELVENSLDAASTKIKVFISGGITGKITVIDDGEGMSLDDITLSTLQHTTSKLADDDLVNIMSYGFRGEALFSIAAVSDISISSKKKGTNEAWKVSFLEEGLEKQPISHNEGTTIEVNNLFSKHPARRKFLKSEKREIIFIKDTLKRVALGAPHVGISLRVQEKCLLDLHSLDGSFPLGGKTDSVLFANRIKDICGNDFFENSFEVNLFSTGISISGRACFPTFSKKSTKLQFFIVNSRAVKSFLLSGVLRRVYADYIPRDRYPVYCIKIDVPNDILDINVHPKKTEVRFSDEALVANLLYTAVRQGLEKYSQTVSSTLTDELINIIQSPVRTVEKGQYSLVTKERKVPNQLETGVTDQIVGSVDKIIPDRGIDTLSYEEKKKAGKEKPVISSTKQKALFFSQGEHNFREEVDKKVFFGEARCQVFSNYIITEREKEIIIIDQHAVHERILYEKFKKGLENDVLIQTKLIRELVEVEKESLDSFEKYFEAMKKMGLFLSRFDERTVLIEKIPVVIMDENLDIFIQDLAEISLENNPSEDIVCFTNKICSKMACYASIRSGCRLTIQQMNDFLREIEKGSFSAQCNHGRPTYVRLSLKEIERLFGRR